MPKISQRLSARRAATLTKCGRHADGGNLYLNISKNGGRRWVFIYTWQGKQVEMGLGSARPGQVSLAEAREKADRARQLLRDGRNPRGADRSQSEVPTFGAYADALIADIESGFSNAKHIAQWRMTLTKHASAIRDVPVDALTTDHVLKVLKPLWTTRPETASRLRGRIERVLSAAKARGLRSGDNPAQWRGHLEEMLPPPKKLTRGHHPALSYRDVPAFMDELRDRVAPAARALEFLVLTAARSGEVRLATWREINLREGIWTIPATRMKARREHRVPLTERVLALIGPPSGNLDELIFPGRSAGKPLSETAFAALLERMGHGAVTAHGFRSSFRDWAAEETTASREVTEMALAHVIANKAEAAYRRGDLLSKRRELTELWEAYCLGRPLPGGGRTSISLARADEEAA
ncbi:tyrosine-type recombinase/integrase [Candidatus Viadribacter manganicus]|uniref:tyrosine-type recombinase/integrase n=1 Tax=Candidatus Viadribacter manganicus TaxID=1759059 RepID=UPI00082A096A|nr:site-specific integrase [Candidatus Viadribacter manganicus]